MKKTLLAALIFCSAMTVTAQNVVDKIIEIGKHDNRTMEHLDVLSNRIGGRVIGSDAYENAVEWTASEFKKWGLEVMVEEAGVMPVGFNRGPWFGKMLDDDGMTLHFATPSYTSGTKGVQRGHVVAEPKTRAEFERMRKVLNGAWVLIGGKSGGWPIDYSAAADAERAKVIAQNEEIAAKNREIQTANRNNPNDQKPLIAYKEVPGLFLKEMREAGVLGIIQSAPVPIQALYDRNNCMSMTFENLPTLPDIKLDEAQYAIIAQKVKERRYFQLEFDIRNHFKPGPVPFHNVVGMLRGSKYPDQYVMAGGHLDAFDVATGGVDCGSGSVVTMEAARLIAEAATKEGKKPLRSILFCLWAGEEFGLVGSKSWVETHPKDLDKISNYFNRDGGPTVTNSLTVDEQMYPIFEPICKPLNSINPDFPFTLNKSTAAPRPRPTTAGGSDHAYFALNGVPTVGFGTGDPKGYDFSYGEIWHTERDTYNKSIAEYQEHSSIVTAVVLWGLANTPTILPRKGLYLN